MKILHICSAFAKQRLYNNLIEALNKEHFGQIVYVPVRSASEIDGNRNDGLADTTYHYSHILKKYHRIFFHLKTRTILSDLLKKVDISTITTVHAHFLFSDGAVALKLKKKYGIKYVVAVRNTDINFFFRYMKHLKPLAIEILREAKQVIFISPAYKQKLLHQILPAGVSESIAHKCQVIPNGVDDFWLRNPPAEPSPPEAILKLIYVGDFSKNKNIPAIFRAVKEISAVRKVHLTVIGGGGDGELQVKQEANDLGPLVTLHNRINDKALLLDFYRAADIFIMPSFFETFGMVYVEALSQGIPIIYTKGQGIDGYFPDGQVGYAVDPANPSDIAQKVLLVAGNLPVMKSQTRTVVDHFQWHAIAKQYQKIYKS